MLKGGKNPASLEYGKKNSRGQPGTKPQGELLLICDGGGGF